MRRFESIIVYFLKMINENLIDFITTRIVFLAQLTTQPTPFQFNWVPAIWASFAALFLLKTVSFWILQSSALWWEWRGKIMNDENRWLKKWINLDCFLTIFNLKGLLMNIIGGAVIIVWSFSTTLALYAILRYFDVHRATPRQEKLGDYQTVSYSMTKSFDNYEENLVVLIKGLDLAIHNQAAYNMEDRIERIDSVESLGMTTLTNQIFKCAPMLSMSWFRRDKYRVAIILGNRSTAKVQPSSAVPYGLRRMVSEPHIHAW